MVIIRFIVMLLVIIGALNWGLWGFFQYDLIADIFGGPSSGWSRFIFAIVGLAGIYAISFFGRICCHKCHKCGSSSCHGQCQGGDHKDQNQGPQNPQGQ